MQVLPPWLTTVLLAALLLLLSSKLIHRGVLTYRSETKVQRAAVADAEQSAALEAPLLNGGVHFSAVTLPSSLSLLCAGSSSHGGSRCSTDGPCLAICWRNTVQVRWKMAVVERCMLSGQRARWAVAQVAMSGAAASAGSSATHPLLRTPASLRVSTAPQRM